MKIRKNLVKIIVVGSIFFISSMSFVGLISLQDDNLNAFWSISKLDTSFISNTYAESGGGESGKSWSYQKESGDYEKESGNYKPSTKTDTISGASTVDNKKIKTDTALDNKNSENYTTKNIIQNDFIKENKIELTNEEKVGVKLKFTKLNNTINEKYKSSTQKLEVYNRLVFLVDKKIKNLEKIKSYITDKSLLEKYEKKILIFKELNILTQETILVYVDNIDLVGNSNIVSNSNTGNNYKTTNENNVVDTKSQTKASEAARLAKIEADRIAAAQAAEKARIAAEQAKPAEAARLAKIEADRIAAAQAAEKARIAAAQAAAQAATTTHTSAS